MKYQYVQMKKLEGFWNPQNFEPRTSLKDFGIGKWDHNNATILNLFLNFKKTHINSFKHIKMYCHMKDQSFEDYLYFRGSKGKQ
jgi:hypothetical protein